MTRRSALKVLTAIALAAVLQAPAFAADKTVIKVGQTSGPHAKIMEKVKSIAARDGLTIEVIEFGDYIQPNAALDAGDLDANNYQTLPFMEAQIKARGYKIVSVGNTVLFPMGYYSKRFKSVTDLPERARVGIQNDPANSGRSLLLLEKYGVIKLKPGAGMNATPADVIENPKKLRFHQLDSAQLPRSLDDLDIASINTSFAIKAGLNPPRDAIAIEGADSPYTNLLVVRTEDKDKPWVKTLLKAYQSEEIRKFIETEFQGSGIATF